MMWQTCLKAVTAAVSCIHIVHHRSLLAAVSHSTFRSNVELFWSLLCRVFLNGFLPVQILGMSLWEYGTDVMDALVGLLVSLVWLFMRCAFVLLLFAVMLQMIDFGVVVLCLNLGYTGFIEWRLCRFVLRDACNQFYASDCPSVCFLLYWVTEATSRSL